MPRKIVLVVEDDPLLRMDAITMLEEAGLEVVQMSNADDALAFIYEQSADVAGVFSDIQMPGHMSGLHLAETVGRHWPDIRILLCSGAMRPTDTLPSNVTFISKPWRALEVLTAMQDAASQRL